MNADHLDKAARNMARGTERAVRDLPLATDCEHESVLVMVPYVHGVGYFSIWCDVAHEKGRVVRIAPELHWWATMIEHGYPVTAWAEELVHGLAQLQFFRRGR